MNSFFLEQCFVLVFPRTLMAIELLRVMGSQKVLSYSYR